MKFSNIPAKFKLPEDLNFETLILLRMYKWRYTGDSIKTDVYDSKKKRYTTISINNFLKEHGIKNWRLYSSKKISNEKKKKLLELINKK